MSNLMIFWGLFDLFMLGILLYMPIMRKEEAFFGTKVSEETYSTVGRKIHTRYCVWLILSFIQIQVIGLIISFYRTDMPYARLVGLPIFVVAAMIFYVVFARQVKPFQVIEENQRFATSLKVRHLSDYTSIGLEIAVGLTIIIPMLILIYYYPLLPDRIPVHWDWKGDPDRWAEKNFFSVFFLPVVMIYLQGLFWLIKYGMTQVKMMLPAEHTAEYLAAKEEGLRVTMSLVDQIRLLQSILFGGLSLNILSGILSGVFSIKWILGLVVVSDMFILLICAYNIYKMMKIEDRLKAIAGKTYVQRESDAKQWYAGGLFYYNPDDPALFVEKLVGYGYTMNFANKQVYLYIAYGLLLPVGLALLGALGKL